TFAWIKAKVPPPSSDNIRKGFLPGLTSIGKASSKRHQVSLFLRFQANDIMREISPQALRAGKGCTRVRELVRRGASARANLRPVRLTARRISSAVAPPKE
ncbi:MAG: hypothetical protein KA223_09285, partial [Candidatus Accumulibacter sp.]|nr:hypothetical protein [Accumulibacter sp.]